jgi:hypothetical protein
MQLAPGRLLSTAIVLAACVPLHLLEVAFKAGRFLFTLPSLLRACLDHSVLLPPSEWYGAPAPARLLLPLAASSLLLLFFVSMCLSLHRSA